MERYRLVLKLHVDKEIVQEMCYEYWCTSNIMKYREYHVNCISNEVKRGFVQRNLCVLNEKKRVSLFTC